MTNADLSEHTYHIKCTWGDVYVYSVSRKDAIDTARATWGKTYLRCVGRVRPEEIPTDAQGYAAGMGQVTDARRAINRERLRRFLEESDDEA